MAKDKTPRIKRVMKVKEVVALIESDGWALYMHDGTGHRHYKHPTKPGKVTVSGKPSETLRPKTLASILRQAGLNRQA